MSAINRLIGILAAMVLCTSAQAALLTGTFSGVAMDSERVQGVEMFGDFDGARIDGSFGFETGNVGSPPQAWLKFDVPGIVFYDFTGQTVRHFGSDGVNDRIELIANGFTPEPSGRLTFTGPAGAFALTPSGIDLARFDPSAILLEYLSGDFGARRGPSASIRFDHFVFDGYPATVPEPASLALFGIGLLAIAMVGRRQARRRKKSRA